MAAPPLLLPIDPLLPEIVASLEARPALVIEAPPGAGKTTRVPRALLDAGFARAGEIVVLQPRRLPARLGAERVAEEMGERVGGTVGYTVRFEDASSARTRLRFVTEGVLTRRLLADPRLGGVAAVVLDEFHERHLSTDLALALLRALQTGPRPELRLCVMSATLEAEPVRAFLGDCPSVRSEGRRFDVAIEHAEAADDRPLAEQVVGAVRRLAREGLDGDVLVFLPGAGEIRRCAEALAPTAEAQRLLVLPLHGELPPAEQLRAVRPAERRKVILSTNVAETSVTIDGVVAVVDTGLARIAGHSPWSGLATLTVGKISQAAAIQRAGRAGRTRPGRALRLYTRHDFESRRAFEVPEIERLDLTEPLLALHASGVRAPASFAWFEPPPAAATAAGEELLRRLGAVDREGALTDTGRAMLRVPLHPRLGRLVVEGQRRGVADEAAALAALISERDVNERGRVRFGGDGPRQEDDADLLERLDRFRQAAAASFARDRLRGLGLDGRAVEAAERARRQIGGALRAGPRPPGPASPRPASADGVDEALAMATLTGFPDRVMRRRAPAAREAVLAGGGVAEVGLSPPQDLLVAVDAEERGAAGGKSRGVLARLAVAIEPEWLLELVPEGVSERDELAWNAKTERVERVTSLAYGLVVLEETRKPAQAGAETTRLLVAAARAAGWGALLGEGASTDALAARVETLRRGFPEEAWPALDEQALGAALAAACEGRTGFAELRAAGLVESLLAGLGPSLAQRLRADAPERLRLPGGREVTVHYERDKPPWIESRLQDFFGSRSGPAVCRGRVPLVLHLLAPNGRAVQVTQDLPRFWQQHYPALRRELSRRYPRHPWPEDGATATPPAPRPPRPR
jgi:ATP-dependent helicase HrpB